MPRGLVGASSPRMGGYLQYGNPQVPTVAGGGLPINPAGMGYGTAAIVQPALGAPAITLGWPASGQGAQSYPVTPSNSRLGTRVATGGPPRWVDTVRAVLASTPQSRALGRGAQAAAPVPPGRGPLPPRSNVPNPLFGRPGFTYVYNKSQPRMGPAFKGSPGTGLTGRGANRSLGFVPAGYATGQYVDLHQFDYMPPTQPSFDKPATDVTPAQGFRALPRTINVGADGVDLVGTYRAHDFTPADRFIKQFRSTDNWQDMSFGPDARMLTQPQMVARYNLMTEIRLARGPSQNMYFLGYQTQPNIASQLGGVVGQAAPLGYGSH